MAKTIIDRKYGFTLIELLIVIALIAILTAISAVSFSTIQKKSRDSRRINDLKAIQNAFEQYYGDNSAYPSSCASPGDTYLPSGMPTDPKGVTPYIYGTGAVCDSTGYCYCATLENTTGGNSSTTGCVWGTGQPYYCVKNLQ